MKFVIFILPFAYNFLYLFNRKSNLFKGYRKWSIVSLYLMTGLIYIILKSQINNSDKILEIWSFFTPLIFTTYLSLSTFISKQIYNRDFKLFLMYSNEIDYLNPRKSKSKPLDKIISYFALILIFILPFFITIFF